MLELTMQFTPADGSAPRTIAIHISDVKEIGQSWSARVEILGFKLPDSTRIHGVDWAQAIELTAKYIPIVLEGMINSAGGGTLEPPIYPRAIDDAAPAADIDN
jgi:hypothetical protein